MGLDKLLGVDHTVDELIANYADFLQREHDLESWLGGFKEIYFEFYSVELGVRGHDALQSVLDQFNFDMNMEQALEMIANLSTQLFDYIDAQKLRMMAVVVPAIRDENAESLKELLLAMNTGGSGETWN